MAKKYVPEGAFLACNKGTSPSTLRVSNNKSTTIYSVPMATELDFLPFFNLKPMGLCTSPPKWLTGVSCIPTVIDMWKQPKDGVKINGSRMLLEDSFCNCIFGGKINIFFDRNAAVEYGVGEGKMPSEYIKQGFDWIEAQNKVARDFRDQYLPDWMKPVAGVTDWFSDFGTGLVEGAVNGVVGLGETLYQVAQDPVGTAEALHKMGSDAVDWASKGENWTKTANNVWDWGSKPENWRNAIKDGASWVAENPRKMGNTLGEFIPDAVAAAYTMGGSTALSAGKVAVKEVAEEAVERAVREGVKEAGERAAREIAEEGAEAVGQKTVREVIEAVGDDAADIARVTDGSVDDVVRTLDDMTPGSPAHKAQRWREYQERGGEWNYDRWSKTYDNNMQRARIANQAVDDYHNQLGWGKREVTVDVNGQPRRLDIADVADKRGVEVKSGEYFSRTEDIMSEIARDRQLVDDGWDITWKIDGKASQPLLDELKNAGITVIN